MREKRIYLLIGCAIGLAVAAVGIILKVYFTPVGEVNGKMIYSHQVQPYAAGLYSNAVTNYVKDKIFFNAMANLGIVVSDKIIDKEYQKCIQRNNDNQKLALDKTSIKRAILHQKALAYFAEKTSPNEDEISIYFERHSANFPKGLEQEQESVKQAVKAELGENAYRRYMEQAEQEAAIKVY